MSWFAKSTFNRRQFLATSAAAAVAGLNGGAAIAAPKRGGHLRVAKGHGSTTDTLDPAIYNDAYMQSLAFGIHGRLTEVASDGSLLPELAESWESSDDASMWRFKIRSGVAFHDGKSLTVNDVVASINHHRGEGSTSAAKSIVDPIVDISTDGQDTVVFTLSGGNADFPFILSDYHLVICPATENGIDWQSGNGCGSYVLKNFEPGVVAELVRNPNHWRDDVGWFESCELLSIIDQNARTTALSAGDVHAIDRVDLKVASLLQSKPGIKVESVTGAQHYTFAMSTSVDPFTNVHVRQALKYAINREELVEKILFDHGSVGNDHPIGPNQRFFNTELEQRAYDPEKAKWHLKQAGLGTVEVSLHVSDTAFSGAVDAALLFQDSAKNAGIDLNVVREPKDGYWSDVWMKKPFSAVYWLGRPVEDQMFSTVYKCGAPWNDTDWCNDRFEKLLSSASAELDTDKRREMYWEMQEVLANDGGVIAPMFANFVFALSDEIGHGDLASNSDMDGERWMERWWFA